MKKTELLTYYTLLAFIMLVSCTEDDTALSMQHSGLPITVQSEIMQQYVTRAADGGFADGDQIGIFVVNRNANNESQQLLANGNHADNVAFRYDYKTNKWTGSRQLYWKDESTHIDVYGYYPYDAAMNSVEAYPFQVQCNQQSEIDTRHIIGYEASDFLWAKVSDVVPAETTINLQHHHLMAGIRVTLVEGIGFEEGEWDKTEKSVLVENTNCAATINIATGKISLIGSELTSIVPLNNRETEWRAVVVPQTIKANSRLLSITIDGINYPFERSEAMTYLSGKLHQFTIAVSKHLPTGDYELKLVDESITAWENDSESHNGATKEYVVVNIEDGEYLGDVLKHMNLDPERVVNLKLTGTMDAHGYKDYTGYVMPYNFDYIRTMMPNLEAINMYDLHIVRSFCNAFCRSWRYQAYGEDKGDNIDEDVIPYRAFYGAAHLRYVVLPKNCQAVGDEAFYQVPLDGSLILPDGLKYVGESAYSSFTNSLAGSLYNTGDIGHSTLTGELYIPQSVEYIGNEAFCECDFNCELVLPHHMIYLGNAAFRDCQFLYGNIRVPEGLETVYPSWINTHLGGVVEIPSTVKNIEGLDCIISGIVIPEGVEEVNRIGFDPDFHYSEFITSRSNHFITYDIELPSTVKKLNQFAFYKVQSPHIRLSEGIENIPYSCFEQAALRDTMNIPEGVTQIDSHAFFGCHNLDAIVLPSSLMTIGEGAFYGCYRLNYIRCKNSTPPTMMADNVMGGVNKESTVLVVPSGCVDAYRNAPGWSEFKRITTYCGFACRPMGTKLLNKGGVRRIILNTDDDWKVSHCPSWVLIDKNSGNKKTELQVTISKLPVGSHNRKDSIVFQLSKNGEDGLPITCCYRIEQYNYEYDENQQLVLQQATQGRGINILFIGDGYDAEDIATGQYMNEVRQDMDYFFGIEPYKTYRSYFNVGVAVSVSSESGVESSSDVWRDTKFGVRWNSSCDNRQRIEADNDEMARYVLQDIPNGIITADNIDGSLIICLANSNLYEGITVMYSSGAAIAICPHSLEDYPYDARGIIQHEAGGHGFGKLADEYIFHNNWIQLCNCKDGCGHVLQLIENKTLGWARNLSLTGNYNQVEWRQLIYDPRYSDVVDIYEGGFFHRRGVYRSEPNSCMNNNVPYFSTVSRMAIVERIMELAGEPFDYEQFVSRDSREMGDKFITRSVERLPSAFTPAYGENHHPLFRKGSPVDYLKNRKKH